MRRCRSIRRRSASTPSQPCRPAPMRSRRPMPSRSPAASCRSWHRWRRAKACCRNPAMRRKARCCARPAQDCATSDIAVLMAAGVTQLRVRAPRMLHRQYQARRAGTGGAIRCQMRAGRGRDRQRRSRTAIWKPPCAQDSADAVIGIGGTGSGRRDRSVIALSRTGKLTCHGIGLAPGETAAFGHVGGRPVLLVPGRVDAAIACWLVLGRALVARLAGGAIADAVSSVKLARKVTSTIGIAEFVPLAIVGRRRRAARLGLSVVAIARAGRRLDAGAGRKRRLSRRHRRDGEAAAMTPP